MSFYLVEGATLKCSKGSIESILMIPNCPGVFLKGKKRANKSHYKGMLNIMPFGICSITGNTCIPQTLPWLVDKKNVLLNEVPTITDSSLCMCSVGGVVEVVDDGQE